MDATSTSGAQSSQAICAFLNRFEKSLYENGEAQDESLEDVIREEMDTTELAEAPRSSAEQAKRYSKKFKHFLNERGLSDDIEQMPESKLCLFLRYFYHNLRGEDGSLLSPSTS